MNKKIVIQLLGVLSYALTQWLLLVFLTRLYGLTNTAQYIYYLAFFTPLSIFFAYGLRNGVASDKDYIYKFSTYLKLSYLGVLLYTVVGVAFFYFIDNLNISLFMFTFLLKLNEMISEPYYGRFLRSNNSHQYAYSKIYKFSLGCLFFVTFWVLENKLDINYFSFYGYIIAIYIVFFTYDKSNKNLIHDKEESKTLFIKLVIANSPLAISAFIIALNSSMPKIIFGWNEQSAGLAIFGFLIYFNSVAVLPITAITQILFGKRDINKRKILYKIVTIYSFIYFISFIILSPYVLKYIYTIDMGYNFTSLVYAALCGIIQFFLVLNNFFMIYYRQFRYVLYTSLFSVVINSLLCMLLIKYGLNGILMSVLITGLITISLSIIFLRLTYTKNNF